MRELKANWLVIVINLLLVALQTGVLVQKVATLEDRISRLERTVVDSVIIERFKQGELK